MAENEEDDTFVACHDSFSDDEFEVENVETTMIYDEEQLEAVVRRGKVPTEAELDSFIDASASEHHGAYEKYTLAMKLFAIKKRLYGKTTLDGAASAVKAAFGIAAPRRSQVSTWCQVVDKIYDLALESKNANSLCRIRGGGRKRTCVDKEAAAAEYVEAAHRDGRRVSWRVLKEILGTESEFVVHNFMAHNGLVVRKCNVQLSVPPEVLRARLENFHNTAEAYNRVLSLTAETIVQCDEIATSFCGAMKTSLETIVPKDTEGAVTALTSWADCAKKYCTAVHFLTAGRHVPPLILLKGSGHLKTAHLPLTAVMTKAGCTTGSVFSEEVIKHLSVHAPNCKLLVIDSASSHTTAEVEKALKGAGIMPLVIPGGTTSFAQVLDTSFFATYRTEHARIMTQAVESLGAVAFRGATEAEKRMILFTTIKLASEIVYNKIADNVEQLFIDHGYLMKGNKMEVRLRNLPSYIYKEPDEQFLIKIVNDIKAKQAKILTPTEVAVRTVCELRLSQSREPKPTTKKERRPDCTCDKKAGSGRHKKTCARSQNKIVEKRQREEVACPTPTPENLPHSQSNDALETQPGLEIKTWVEEVEPHEVSALPKRGPSVEEVLAVCDLVQINNHVPSYIDVEEVETCDGVVKVAVSLSDKQDNPLWSCFPEGELITSREIRFWVEEIRRLSPNAEVYDDVQFECLRKEGGHSRYPPHRVGSFCCVVANYKCHFVSICYNPVRRIVWIYDSQPTYMVQERSSARDAFLIWLQDGGNGWNGQAQIQSQRPGEVIGRNDCALFAVNGIVSFTLRTEAPIRGALSRAQMKQKFEDRSYCFQYVPPEYPTLTFLFEQRCPNCQATLVLGVTKVTLRSFKRCDDVRCVQANTTFQGYIS